MKRPGASGTGELGRVCTASLEVITNPHAMACCECDMVSMRMHRYDVRGKMREEWGLGGRICGDMGVGIKRQRSKMMNMTHAVIVR